MRDDWTTYRFAIYDSWVAFDVTNLLTSGSKPARFSIPPPRHYATIPRPPPRAVLNQTGSAISRFLTAKTRRKKKGGFRKKIFEISISPRIDLANKNKSVICTLKFIIPSAIIQDGGSSAGEHTSGTSSQFPQQKNDVFFRGSSI